MSGIEVITTPRGDWSLLTHRPEGWKLRRLERTDTHCVYVAWDPDVVRCAFFLSAPPTAAARSLTADGWTRHHDQALSSTGIWHSPVTSPAWAA